MAKIKEYLGAIITFAAVVGIVIGALNYLATADEVKAVAEELRMVEMRLDQKIVGDQMYSTQQQIWALEERNTKFGSDCSQWPDARDREQYKKLKVQHEELQKKQDKMIQKEK